MAHAERLSAVDAHFLELEDDAVHMHVAVLLVFETGPLAGPDGGVDVERIRAVVASQLHRVPRYRQRLARIPVEGHPVWVDDPHFNLAYHVRHVAVPRPGDARQLKRLTGLVLSQKLDPRKPLWEIWVMEGLESNRFALLVRAHHCMVDGIAGVGVLSTLLRPTPDDALEAPPPWRPRPAPGGLELLAGALWRRGREPAAALGALARSLRAPRDALAAGAQALTGLGETAAEMRPASPTPLNPDHVGAHRRFDCVRFELNRVRAVKERLGGTLNDVVLATVAGAVRRFLRGRGVALRDLDFHVFCPVSVRPAGAGGPEGSGPALGNRVVLLIVPLPLAERDPRRRLERVTEATRRLKRSHVVEGAQLIEELAEHTATALVTQTIRLALRLRTFNLIVTNVPGPPMPLYLLGAPLVETWPVVPLYPNQAVGIALLSYAGGLHWGVTGDWDRVPDLHALVEALEASFDELAQAAGLPVGASSAPPDAPDRTRPSPAP